MAAIFIAVIAAVVAVALYANRQYQDSLAENSAQQMVEYGGQIVSVINAQSAENWEKAQGIGYILNTSKYTDAEELLDSLKNLTDIWGLQNIILYTDSGSCFTEDGSAVNIDSASDQVYKAETEGKYETIVGSQIYYMVPVDTDMTMQGSGIAAAAIVKDLSGIIGNMNLKSYGNTAKVYYTQSNGLVISRSENGEECLNIESLYQTGIMTKLLGNYNSFEDAVRSDDTCAYLYEADGVRSYVVLLPLVTDTGVFNVVIDSAVSEVDRAMNDYSGFLTWLYIGISAVIAAALVLLFSFFYHQRMKNIREVMVRENMLDLLVSNTNNVFALFSVKQQEPVYVSPNQAAVTGDGSRRMLRITEDGKLQFSYEKGGDEEYLKELNAELADWDGKGNFTSRYLKTVINGEIKYLESNVYFTGQQNAEYILTTTDVSKEYEREETLRAALSMADDASKAKTAFLSNMSHDIRTPMNAIVNMTDFALQNLDHPDQLRQYLDTIKTSSNHLLQLINDILDMSRIESGKMEIEAEPFNAAEQFDQVISIIEPLCRKRSQTFIRRFEIMHETLKGDNLKAKQIVINLLNNAVKFTPEGGRIEFEIREEKGLTEKQTILHFTVRDNGVGMSMENQENIFQPFQRIRSSGTERVEGSGLGLSICKSFTEAMGGSIALKSVPGKGSEFHVRLPFEIAENNSGDAEAHDETQISEEQADFSGKRALLCEDNEINRQIAGMLLESIGFRVDSAVDGKEGYRKFLESEPGTYDIIFMDIQMPEMNGYDTTVAIRASSHEQAGSIPIIAMTANVFKEDVERAGEVGMNGHIAKPLEKKAIISAAYRTLKTGVEK